MLEWFNSNGYAISMFVSGWCAFAAFDNLIKGQYLWAAINAVVSFMNIKLARIHNG